MGRSSEQTLSLADWRAVLAFIEEGGRKVGKSKLFEDIKKGRLKRQADGSFRPRDVERYMAALPLLGTSDSVAERAADRQRRKEEQEIRRISAIADKEEFLLAVRRGQFIPKEQVHQELAARAVTLATGLKTAFEARALDIIALVEGSPKKAAPLIELLEALLEEALGEYSREMEIIVEFAEPASGDETREENDQPE